MHDFTYYTPTRVVFGKGAHLQVGKVIKDYGYKKVLLVYGKGSIKQGTLYDEVISSLNDNQIAFIEQSGIEPNPKLKPALEAAEACKREGVDLVLAIGGGSAIDSAKMTAIAAVMQPEDGSPWDYSLKKAVPTKALPVGVILTISASGSEMSMSCVVTNEDTQLKRGFNADVNRPLFALCNPELTYTVNKFQTGCGIVDIIMHTLERYFGNYPATELTDRIAEGLIKSVINAGRVAMTNPNDYEARATLMWASSLSHNGLTGAGRDFFFVCHQIGHELSGKYDFVAHGAGLSALFIAWAKYVYKADVARFAQYAVRVWDVEPRFDDLEATAWEGIIKTEEYFKSIDMPVRLADLGVEDDSGFEEMANKCTQNGEKKLPGTMELGKKEIIDIFKLANF